jgi:hypothetical protein
VGDRLGVVIVHLKDGRDVDVSGLTVDEAIAKIRAAGVEHPIAIKWTEHRISRAELERAAVRS